MLKEKRDLLGQKKEQRQAIYDKCITEKRARTEDETRQWETLGTEIADLEKEIRFLEEGERESRANATVVAVHGGVSGNTHSSTREQTDLRGFSLGKVIRAKLEGRNIDGVEAEVLQAGVEEARAAGANATGNVILPYKLFTQDTAGNDLVMRSLDAGRERRDMTATGQTTSAGDQGGLTIQTTIGQMYLALYNNIVLQSLGATFMPNMVGNYTIPRFIDPDDPAFKAENAAADESSPTVAAVTLTPKRLPTFVEISNQLLQQSNENIARIVQNGLVQKLSSKADRMGIQGTGAANQPRGILNTSGIGAVFAGGAPLNTTNANGAALKWEDVVNLYKNVNVANAAFGSLGYLTNPMTTGAMQATPKLQNTAGITILPEGATTLNGFRLGTTNNVPSNLAKGSSNSLSAMIFGNFTDLHICTWGGIDLLINPYSRDTEGITRINAGLYMDSAVARPESFAAIKDIVA